MKMVRLRQSKYSWALYSSWLSCFPWRCGLSRLKQLCMYTEIKQLSNGWWIVGAKFLSVGMDITEKQGEEG